MRIVVVFALFLFFLLFGSYHDVRAEAITRASNYSSASIITGVSHERSVNTYQDLPLIKSNGFIEKKDDFTRVENEDEEEDVVFARKYILLTKYFVTLACVSVFSYFYNYIKNRLPFCRHFSYTSSYKYILQRVLRI